MAMKKRDALQAAIDTYHTEAPPQDEMYTTFLERIGYITPSVTDYKVTTANVDPEIASTAGPQLVCPADNDRFLLNAANARWGSLFDALYASNALLPGPVPRSYDAVRGGTVLDAINGVLDESFPLSSGRWADVSAIKIDNGQLRVTRATGLAGETEEVSLRSAESLAGVTQVGDGLGDGSGNAAYWSVLLARNGLHAELIIDSRAAGRQSASHPEGSRATTYGLIDVQLESATTTIADFEDSACTVDAEDKVRAYRNWLGLMTRTLACDVAKGDGVVTRNLHGPRTWSKPDGTGNVELPGQALLLARNVGMHMLTDAVVGPDGAPTPEHVLDAMITVACALHDVRGPRLNSREGSVYIVKPKMHGPEEVQLAVDIFGAVEEVLGLPFNTIKMGIMDEERRTSVNLAATLRPAHERLVFVNTGFLDRTADEIHTSMHAGPMRPRAGLKGAWYAAYEQNNVETCIARKLVGRGQIGKGMWAEPDDLKAMISSKGEQLTAGASTAWVPSPVAATLHALHYHRIDVATVQANLTAARDMSHHRLAAQRADLLSPPVMSASEVATLAPETVQLELDNNVQSLLGYVVRWVGQGIGCSKVPNMEGLALMEDRATLRISSQHIANWLHHGIVSKGQVMETLNRVAALVDEQNMHDSSWQTPLTC